MELYVRDGCPYCARVLKLAHELGIALNLHNIADPAVARELVARGGKQQVPYLVDAEARVEMYESEDIVAYLQQQARGTEKTEGTSAA